MLRNEVSASINKGLRAAAQLKGAGSTSEVDVLFGLFCNSLPDLDGRLRNLLGPLSFSCRVAGVFCHQSPKVVFSGASSVELADLLVVCRYQDDVAAANNALLLQTKLSKEPKYRPDKQLDLYTRWPEFRWKATGDRRRVNPRPGTGAQFGFIDVCDGGCPKCAIRTAVPPAIATVDLADVLVGVLLRTAGRPFAERRQAQRGRNWDRVIWDLLDGTVRGATFLHSRGDANRQPRKFDPGRIAALTVVSPWGVTPLILGESGRPDRGRPESIWDRAVEPGELAEVPPPRLSGDEVGPLDDYNAISTIFIDLSPAGLYD